MGRFFIGIFSNEISATFSVIIFIAFAFGVFAIFRREEGKFYSGFAGLAPNALTSLGILGTFTGIFIGLLDFDINSINRSVPALLEGLKLAFGTSILGLFAALVLRIIDLFAPSSDVSDEEDVGEKILGQMKALVELAEDNKKITSEGFANLHKSITGDEDSSLTGQLQRLRAGMADIENATRKGFDEQIQEFKAFAEHMSKAFSEAIIDELRDVIREFNEKISEQFGDNFKQLNEAVGKLLEWQDKYREHIERLEARFEESAKNLEAVQQATKSIADSTASIPEHMKAYDGIMEGLKEHLTALHEGLASIAEMREKAEGAFPEISEKITGMVDTMQGSASRIFESANAVSESANTSVKLVTEAVQDQLESLKGGFDDLMEKAVEQLNATIKNSADSITETVKQQGDTQTAMLNSLKGGFDELMDKAVKELNEAIAILDREMEKEIGRVIEEIAKNLGGTSQQFVKDYALLLEQSRKIVELGKTAAEGRS